ncbi:histidine kinase [Achromobacter sp. GG226]|uniref:sensor histidine kinase n=1 Tax=Verticiella alkaliphila TaxID=2779529 RepID=UPI001C0B2859|nr:ATP-binding protein [Verticiella sp. GG226]MBU4613060.1 histidine kinase [Verticiella sp. GG226]
MAHRAWARLDGPQLSRSPKAAPILAACVFFWFFLVFAGPRPGTPTHAVGRDIGFSYYRDADGSLDLDTFLALPEEALSACQQPLSRGFDTATYWLRFDVPAAAFPNGELWLVMSPNYLDEATVFLGNGLPGVWRVQQAGDRHGVRTVDMAYRFPVYRLSPPEDGASATTVVLRVSSTSALIVEPALWLPSAFLTHATLDTATWSFYFGVAALASTLALLLALALGSRLLWSVVPFSLCYLLAACIQGYVGWPNTGWRLAAQDWLVSLLTLLSGPALLWMSLESLDVRRHFPRVYRAMIGMAAAMALVPLSLLLDSYRAAHGLLAIWGMLSLVIMLFVSLAVSRRVGGGLLTIAIGVLPLFYTVSSLLSLLMSRAVVPYDARIFMLWQYSTMLVMSVTVLAVLFVGVQRIRQEQLKREESETLARELARERAASFHQRQFMAMVSHEFRTPLAVISGTLENLAPPADADTRVRQRHDKIHRALSRLVQLTDNCMADARLSADALYLDRQPVDLIAELRQAAVLVERSDAHRLRITVDGAEVTPHTPALPLVQADPALLRIALSNLLDNAVKYTPRGQVSADIRLTRDMAWLTVQDQGPGIPPDQSEAVFERYRRGGRPEAARPEGSGLGLFVARQIARGHGGDLVLAENAASGCRFVLSLSRQALPMDEILPEI